jgi:hypothetical protein
LADDKLTRRQAAAALFLVRSLHNEMPRGGRPIGSGVESKLDLQSLCITATAELWRKYDRQPTLEAVAWHIGKRRSGLGRAFKRHGIVWNEVLAAARRQCFGSIKPHIAT